MNDTIINANVVYKLKQLVQDVEDLQVYNIGFGLNFEQEVQLAKLQIEINQIIKEL